LFCKLSEKFDILLKKQPLHFGDFATRTSKSWIFRIALKCISLCSSKNSAYPEWIRHVLIISSALQATVSSWHTNSACHLTSCSAADHFGH
jgi:hypothetical protein